jgi:DNA-binding CsgD family transcriptional regulator
MTGMRDILRPTKYSMTKTRKNPPETTRKTIPKKYTNDAKRHIKEEPPVAICVSHNALAETSQNNGFQIKHMHSFSRENTKTRPIKRRKTPSYRRINIYSKSPLQYQKERQRRRKALELVSQGLTLSQIAKELGVGVKTVQRDLSKLERYVKGQVNQRRYLLDQERQRELKSLSTISLLERLKMLSRLLFRTRKLSKKEEYEQHNITIVFDMNDLTADGSQD